MKQEPKMPLDPTEKDWHTHYLWQAHNSDQADVLEEVAKSRYADVLLAVIANPSTDISTLRAIAYEQDGTVKNQALKTVSRRLGLGTNDPDEIERALADL
jgi:hypothetical protein